MLYGHMAHNTIYGISGIATNGLHAGRAMGLALLHGEVLPGAHFTPNFLKGLLGQPTKLEDLQGNPPVHNFLKQLAAGQYKYAVSSSFEEKFCAVGLPAITTMTDASQSVVCNCH